MNLNHLLKEYTEKINRKGLLRDRILLQKQRQNVLCFDSNDYLSLTNNQIISNAYQKGYKLFPSGSGGSMVLNGYHPNHKAFEQAMATWLEVDECIVYSSGYAANLAVMSLLGQLKLTCLIDKGVHASVYDGLKLSRVSYSRYLHNNLEDLREKIKLGPDILITEGIFSMSGQMSSLTQLSSLCLENQVTLLIDEAHSFGLIGNEGKGSISYHGLTQEQVPLRIIPLGKAFAGQGAIVAGQKLWITALLQASRSLIYSTAISPALSHGLLKTLDVVRQAEERREKLKQLIAHFRDCIKTSNLTWADSITPIQQVQLGCPHLALNYSAQLQEQGIYCSAIRQPTVSLKASGLRILLNYHHQPEDINRLFQQLALIYDYTPH